MPRPIDRDALLAFLDRKVEERGKSDVTGLVITSVYSGLANRIRSGEFDSGIVAGPWGSINGTPTHLPSYGQGVATERRRCLEIAETESRRAVAWDSERAKTADRIAIEIRGEHVDPGFEHHEPHCHLQHGLGGQCSCR